MKVLVAENFKAKYIGEFVPAHVNEKRGEFVLDTTNKDQFEFAILEEVAQANGFSLKKEKKEKVLLNLEAEIIKLNLQELNQMTDTQKVQEIVSNGFAAKKSEDEMIVEIVQSGVPFKRAYRLFKDAMEEGGFKISPKKRSEEVTKILTDCEFEPKEFSEVEKVVETICEKVKDTNEVQALKLVKKFCTENAIAFPAKPKAPKGGLLKRFLDECIKNPAITNDEAAAWVLENASKKDKAQGYTDRFMLWLDFARDFSEAKAK
jgi:hypothetical protein